MANPEMEGGYRYTHYQIPSKRDNSQLSSGGGLAARKCGVVSVGLLVGTELGVLPLLC